MYLPCCFLPFLFISADTYSNGPPTRACNSMIPEHDGGGSLSTDTPYTLAVSEKSLRAGGTLMLKFSRSGNLDFRGFLIQARDGNTDKIIGTFTSIDRTTTRKMNCLSKRDPPDAISHTNGDLKSSVTATWTAPEFYGTQNRSAIFYFTVVYSQNIFWAKQNSGIRIQIAPKVIDQQKLKSDKSPSASASAAKEMPSPYLGCGTKKGCFGIPQSDCIGTSSCKALFTYKYHEKNKRFNFALAGPIKGNGYIAVAFSDGDAVMGEDVVVSCRKTPRGGIIAMGWNDKRANVDRQMGLNIRAYEIREVDGIMTCKFQVNDKLMVSKATLDDKLSVDLLEEDRYYLLLSEGSLSSDGSRLSKHKEKASSSSTVNFKSMAVIESGSYVLYQMHGIFMVIAWLGLSSMGMMIARYFKNTWTDIQVLEKDLWFIIHQGLMIGAVVLTLLGAIFALSKAGFFPYDSKFISSNPHPVIGGLTIGLSLLQPIMGALRPSRGTQFRPYFNVAHWILGNIIYILAVAAIFLAIDLENARLPSYASWVLLTFFILHALFHIGLSVQSHMIDEDTNKVADSQGNMRQNSRRDQVGAICRKVSLVAYAFLLVFIVLFMIVLICVAPGNSPGQEDEEEGAYPEAEPEGQPESERV